MVWVVEQIVDRVRHERGVYALHEWERFCADHGIAIVFADLTESLPSFYIAGTIVLGRHLSAEERAYHAWHEAYHALYCVGSREEWLRLMVCGDLCVRKFERQADEFATGFPVWGAG